MCNITLTRRRGSRLDGTRYCTVLYGDFLLTYMYIYTLLLLFHIGLHKAGTTNGITYT